MRKDGDFYWGGSSKSGEKLDFGYFEYRFFWE